MDAHPLFKGAGARRMIGCRHGRPRRPEHTAARAKGRPVTFSSRSQTELHTLVATVSLEEAGAGLAVGVLPAAASSDIGGPRHAFRR
jgi:hypothetical protein